MREWAAARDRDEHDSDDPPPEVQGLFAALTLRDDGWGGGRGRNTVAGMR